MAAIAGQCANAGETKPTAVYEDRQFYTQGAYSLFASPWSSFIDKSLRPGIDYKDTIEIDSAVFPSHTYLAWRWPAHRPTKTGVWGYMLLSYGNYDGGASEAPMKPAQVNGIKALAEDFDWSAQSAGEFNVLNEFYLTAAPGAADRKLIEIGFFLHASQLEIGALKRVRFIGAYTDAANLTWEVFLDGNFCMILPKSRKDQVAGHIDIKSMLSYLKARGVIFGSEWLNGLALGVEPVSGAGSLKVNHWAVSYQGHQ